MWPYVGLTFSLVLALVAWRQSGAQAGFHAEEIYGMDGRSHARFALLCLAFAAAFALAAARPLLPAIPLLAAFTLASILYLTSFLQGYRDHDG